ncbi:G-type lectin S-receptor-like serine/threonine-protein kinase isoform X1 [Tanacetum coccineum]|uniref:Receptor-like serine/threonine-protein kinase n=1 Tax=Tanacetum coccineum TaxID=301880 RepID=A0ABQ5AEW1_9ASTR
MDKLTLTFLLHSGILISLLSACGGVDTITLNQTIKDGDTIVSSGENYEMGFFSPGTSKNRYIGIWYKKISTCTVVWVANRETPLSNKSGVLKVGHNGLELLNGNKTVIWSMNTSESVTTSSLVAQLLDNGNLVVRDQEKSIWQSFDYPGDTLLSGMRISMDLLTGKDIHLTSWKTDDDPSAGPYTLWVDPNGYPQLFERQNLVRQSRFGPWNGVTFNGMPNLGEKLIFTHQFVVNEKEIYYKYELVNNSLISRLHLSPDGSIQQMNWIESTQSWGVLSTATPDNCANYAICGAYGVCNINNSPSCSCLEGFEPQNPEEWIIADFTSGCKRINPLSCGNGDGDGFCNISGMKFPDTNNSWYNQSMTLGECELACKKNCSCTAYASLDIRNGGSGCLLWFSDLMDVRMLDQETEVLHIRMPASELTRPTAQKQGFNKKKQTTIIVVSASLGAVLVCVILALYASWRKQNRSRKLILAPSHDHTKEGHMEDTELSSFSLSMIAKSTNNFSINNKLGAGGFGPVYKGVLEDGKEVAVKRLSEASTQGVDEFKNEVRLISKLQHRNLVKLLDNNSGSSMLDWPRRYCIIHGIARGLLYLHQDSRLRIIHRDMKASNILLDRDMNPKISDFGLARRFNGYETEANTNRVAGTYGYIPPEYALHGFYSVKSDVYSFGVLVLEIVAGKKNSGYWREEHNDTLVGHVRISVLRHGDCTEKAEDRPTMSSVVLMLGNENALPPPKQPAFLAEEEMPEHRSISSGPTLGSVNDITITLLDAR